MRDMLRYDDGKIEAIWDYPPERRIEATTHTKADEQYRALRSSVPFTAIVQLQEHTPVRWRSFGMMSELIGEAGKFSPKGYTVDEWALEHQQA